MSAFLGRAVEQHQLKQILFCEQLRQDIPLEIYQRYRKVRLICITGEEGIGKTSLANELYRAPEPMPGSPRFARRAATTAYMDGNWERVLTTLARDVSGDIPHNARIEDIESDILNAAVKSTLLLMLDNADHLESSSFMRFLERWMRNSHKSLLLLTRRTDPVTEASIVSDRDVYYHFPLEGLTVHEDFAVRELLGRDVCKTIDENNLWPAVKKLRNNPQKLLFLRWRSLRDATAVEDCVLELAQHDGDQESPGSNAIETVVKESQHPLAHFLALGSLRVPEFPERLLAYLWDRLGGGSTEEYTNALNWLAEKRLLVVEQREGHRDIRLSASVQMRLRSPMIKYFSQRGLYSVEYYLSQYFRSRFAEERHASFKTQLLEQYVYHALQSGDFRSAYSYLFSGDLLDEAQYRGVSLETLRIIRQMADAWAGVDRDRDVGAEDYLEVGARLKVALAFAHNDLTEHEACLAQLREAERLLEIRSRKQSEIREAVLRALHRKIWHGSGISYSQTGRIDQCISAYSRIVMDGAQTNQVTWFDVLTLGYIAYELKFIDRTKAIKLGEEALGLSRSLVGDRNTELKNLSSLGQIYFYSGKTEEATRIIQESESLLECLERDGSIDRREIGRVLVNAAPLYICLGKYEEAVSRLLRAHEVTKQVGDRRRRALALAYLAIVDHLTGQRDKAYEQMAEAVGLHWSTDAFREALYGTFTVAFWQNPQFDGQLQNLTQHVLASGLTQVIERLSDILEDRRSEVFARYWRECYRPYVLIHSDRSRFKTNS